MPSHATTHQWHSGHNWSRFRAASHEVGWTVPIEGLLLQVTEVCMSVYLTWPVISPVSSTTYCTPLHYAAVLSNSHLMCAVHTVTALGTQHRKWRLNKGVSEEQ